MLYIFDFAILFVLRTNLFLIIFSQVSECLSHLSQFYWQCIWDYARKCLQNQAWNYSGRIIKALKKHASLLDLWEITVKMRQWKVWPLIKLLTFVFWSCSLFRRFDEFKIMPNTSDLFVHCICIWTGFSHMYKHI